MDKKRIFIKVEGIVQGVGFRPFVYNLAKSKNLCGWVNNNSEGVYIDIEGNERNLDSFISELKTNPPPLSKIKNIIIEEKSLCSFISFDIKESVKDDSKITLISPDIATCNDCINDISDPNNRRYRYPFTNCTNCGPRFSIIKSIPYDRDKTTMSKFPMCNECSYEYTDPSNRRFHAQPNACFECGPKLFICDNLGNNISINIDKLLWVQNSLKEGKIFAIKGLSGFHLVCDAKNTDTINLLRKRKNRPHKPFAVMAKNIETVRTYCKLNAKEEEILTGIKKPILLLNRNDSYNLPDNLAPNQKTLGVMLPYTPLHKMLLSDDVDILVMTSANIHGHPLEYTNEHALKNLSSLVDYFVFHNRDIYIPVDDSVSKVFENEERLIRRARGYVPEPLVYDNVKPILACGSNMKNTFCISKENFLFLSQHNGDLENIETIEHYKNNINHFSSIFGFNPQYVACDLHPDYASTIFGSNLNLPVIMVQHHHAHIVSCMVENNINSKVIGIAFDGTGYGTDNKIWGGEFFICSLKNFDRAAHLEYVKMPGGEKAIEEPWRMGISYIYNSIIQNKEYENVNVINTLVKNKFKPIFTEYTDFIINMIEKEINSPETSSIGRFLDAVSAIIGVRHTITYEGQAAIELENIIDTTCKEAYPYEIVFNVNEKESKYIIKLSKTISMLLIDKLNNIPHGLMAAKIHNTIIDFTTNLCVLLRRDTNINAIVLSGGVFQNSYLLEQISHQLKKLSFDVYTHKKFPPNDGGIALGQIVIANENID